MDKILLLRWTRGCPDYELCNQLEFHLYNNLVADKFHKDGEKLENIRSNHHSYLEESSGYTWKCLYTTADLIHTFACCLKICCPEKVETVC